jgi:hypothetical protein
MVILAVAMLASFFSFFKKCRLVAMSEDRLFPMR